MNFKNKLIDYLILRQKWLEGIMIFLLCLAIAFRYDKGETTWLWDDYPIISVIIVLSIVFTSIVWVRIERIKINEKTKKITENLKGYSSNEHLEKLTKRQQEVFHLIAEGKSNKEIMSELYIEHSTLKTHINAIYKTLSIKSRREVKRFL